MQKFRLCSEAMLSRPLSSLTASSATWFYHGVTFLSLFGTPSRFRPHARAAGEATADLKVELPLNHLRAPCSFRDFSEQR